MTDQDQELTVPYFDVAAAIGRAFDHDSPEHWAVINELERACPGFAWHNASTDSAGTHTPLDHGELQIAVSAVIGGCDPTWQPILSDTFDQAGEILDLLVARRIIPPPDGFTRDEVAEEVPFVLREPVVLDPSTRDAIPPQALVSTTTPVKPGPKDSLGPVIVGGARLAAAEHLTAAAVDEMRRRHEGTDLGGADLRAALIAAMPRLPRFTIDGVFHIKGRGPCVSRPTDEGVLARDAGELFQTGDKVRCEDPDDLVATITGIESFAVPDAPQGAFLLDGVELEQLHPGQVWVLDGDAEALPDGAKGWQPPIEPTHDLPAGG